MRTLRRNLRPPHRPTEGLTVATGRRRSCRRKQKHDTREAAEQQLTSLIKNRYASPAYMHVYKCRHCGKYHVGHRLGTGGRRR